MNNKVALPTEQLTLVSAVLPQWIRLLTICQTQTEASVLELMQSYAALVPYLKQSGLGGHEGEALTDKAAHMEAMRHGFQFQDRQRQVLDLVIREITDLCALLQQSPTDPLLLDPARWLERLESKYVMPELRQGASGAVQQDAQPSDFGTDYF